MDFRIIPDEATPWEVYRYLLPTEMSVIAVRRHPFILFPPLFLLAVNVAALALAVLRVIPGGISVSVALGIALPILGYILYRRMHAWFDTWFTITPSRIMLVNWPWKRPLVVIPIDQASDMIYSRTLVPGRLVGYGSLYIKNPGTRGRMLKIRYLPYPEQLYLEVSGLLFSDH